MYEEAALKTSINANVCTALRWRQPLGWTAKGRSYCQMIRDTNKYSGLEWAIENEDVLEDIIFLDE